MPESLFDYYRAIESSSSKMLEAARAEDWDQVVRFEGACAVLIEQLRQRAETEDLPSSQQIEKARIMQRILRNDAEIRLLVEPWLAQLDELLQGRQRYMH